MIIEIHGLVIQCEVEPPDFAPELIRPFSYFKKNDGNPAIKIIVKEEEPPYDSFPLAEAVFSTPRNIVYKSDELKIIDYFGKGMVIEDSTKSLYHIYSRERNFLVEAFYLLILSLFGQFCDRKGMLRIHALCLSYKEKAVLLLGTPGAGKSTMALSMLQEEGFKLVSDDNPLFDKTGNIFPFPVRIGVLDRDSVKFIPDEYVYKIDRMEFGPKYFIDCDYWKDRIEKKPLKDIVIFTTRMILKGNQSIKGASKINILKSLMRDAVVGIGLYQGVEFLFSHSAWESISRIPAILRRLVLAIRLACVSKTYEFTLTRDIGQNACFFKDFIQKLTL